LEEKKMEVDTDKFIERSWEIIKKLNAEKAILPFQMPSNDDVIRHIDQYLPTPVKTRTTKIPQNSHPSAKYVEYEFTFTDAKFTVPKIAETDKISYVVKSNFYPGDEMHTISPADAHQRRLFYSSSLHITVNQTTTIRDENDKIVEQRIKKTPRVHAGEWTVLTGGLLCKTNAPSFYHGDENLIRLKQCPYDYRGYVIIGGKEKICVAQEKLCSNLCVVTKQKNGPIQADIRSQAEGTNNQSSQFLINLCKQTDQKWNGMEWNILCLMPYSLNYQLPWPLFLSIIGVTSKQAQCELIIGKEEDYPDIPCTKQDDENNIQAGRPAVFNREYYHQVKKLLEPSLENFHSSNFSSPRECLEFLLPYSTTPQSVYENLLESWGNMKHNIANSVTIESKIKIVIAFVKKMKNDQFNQLVAKYQKESGLTYDENKLNFKSPTFQNAEECLQIIVSYMKGIEEFVKEKNLTFLELLFQKNLLPHLGVTKNDNITKAQYFGFAVRKMFAVHFGKREEDVRDYLRVKRLETAGTLMKNCLLEAGKKIGPDLNQYVQQSGEDVNIQQFFRLFQPFKPIRSTFKTGKSRPSEMNPTQKTGLTANNQYFSFLGSHSGKERAHKSLKSNRIFFKPRELTPDQYAFYCSQETPDTAQVGLPNNRALTAIVSIGFNSAVILDIIMRYIITFDKLTQSEIISLAKVFLNGAWLGCIRDPIAYTKDLRLKRKQLIIPFETSIVWSDIDNIVYIQTDAGRLLRPLLVLKEGKMVWDGNLPKNPMMYSFWTMIKDGWIEYLDVAEIACDNLLIAFFPHEITKEHTHLELVPSACFGLAAGSITHINHAPPSRNCFGSKMLSQTCGAPPLNFQYKFPAAEKRAVYIQKPLDNTRISELCNKELQLGLNLVTYVLCTGEGMEDQLNMSEKCQKFASFTYHTKVVVDEEEKEGKMAQHLGFIPPITGTTSSTSSSTKKRGVEYLDADGLPQPRDFLPQKSIAIAKYSETEEKVKKGLVSKKTLNPKVVVDSHNAKSIKVFNDLSHDNKTSSSGYVDQVIVSENATGTRSAFVKVSNLQIPQSGYKYSSRNSQKSVLSAHFFSHAEIPFSYKTGLTPDVIFDPNGFPSRGTMNQTLEQMYSKAAAVEGKRHISGSFEEFYKGGNSYEIACEKLRSLGLQEYGEEELRCGITGKILPAKVFVGPVYYLPMKQISDDKLHVKADGPKQPLSRGPAEGKAREGGSRLGEQETETYRAHGTPKSFQERTLDRSDASFFYVCSCGNYAFEKGTKIYCQFCQSSKDSHLTKVPYAAKLIQETIAANHTMWRLSTAPTEAALVKKHKPNPK
jgi:DNA-directed RNA polymerase beta subunit